MFLLYSILVPYVVFFSFGKNIFPFLIVIALFFNYGISNLYYKALIPFFCLYFIQIIIIPFHLDVPFISQLNYLRVDIMGTLLLPFAMLNVMKNDQGALRLFSNTLIIAICIATIYSLYLVTIPGLNPYLVLISPLSGNEFNEAYASADNVGRVFGRISGVFSHPMRNGLFLSLATVFIAQRFLISSTRKEKTQFGLLLLAILISVFFIGVRTAIVATGLGSVVFLLLNRKFILLVYFIFGIGALLVIISQIPGMESFIGSITGSNTSGEVGGSSLDMRLNQLTGALAEIKHNPLFGHGAGWTVLYKEMRGDHPVLLAFESLIFIILCNHGFVGILSWLLMLVLYLRFIRIRLAFLYTNMLTVLIAVYLSYSIITGEYGYMSVFLIFYSILWANGKKDFFYRIGSFKMRNEFRDQFSKSVNAANTKY